MLSGVSFNEGMKTVVLATSSSMPKPDPESHLLVTALEQRGVSTRLLAWDADVDWSAADVVVVRSTWDYFERLDEFLSWADAVESVSCLVNAAAVLRWNTHKRYLTELTDRGVPTVPTAVVEKGGVLADISALFPGHLELVVKPAVSIGAIGAMRARANDAGLAAHLTHLALLGDVLVQPFVSSVVDRGETSLVFAGLDLSHSVRKVPRPGEYRVQDHHGGSIHRHQATAEEIAVARAALAVAPGRCTYARVDLVDTADGPVVMELELVEPALFLNEDPAAPDRFAESIISEL
jgi:glutathione synthase/RimK-type ligase-like ATP-grasp enzyme